MTAPASLAFETSGRFGSIALGIDGKLIESALLPRKKRHNLELMPAIAELCSKHQLRPADLRELYISLGPGSFTGLRIAIATAKMLALINPSLKLVGVSTIDVLGEQYKSEAEHVAVCMNIKRGTMYAGVYRDGRPILAPALRSVDELLREASKLQVGWASRPSRTTADGRDGHPTDSSHISPRPLAIVAEVETGITASEEITILPHESIEADASITWTLGRRLAEQGRFTDPQDLAPLYIREPEAVTLWNELGRD